MKRKRKLDKREAAFLKKLNAILDDIAPAEVDTKDPKLAKAEASLKRWSSKLKRAKTMVRKLMKTVAYYQKKAKVTS